MNRTIVIILAVLALSIAAGLAWYFLFRAPTTIPIVEIPTPAAATETIDDKGEYYEIDATYPASVPTAAGGVEAQATMEAFVKGEAATFKRENVDTLKPEDIEFLQLGGDRTYALGIEYEMYSGTNTLSYVYTIFANTMGAHPNTYYRTFTFDKQTGAELELADLFTPGTEYLKQLSDRSRQELIPHIAEISQIDESEVDTEYLNSGTEPRTENFQWFYLSGETLVLLFPPYQVGPYVLGTQEVSLSVSSLTGYQR